MPVPVFGADRPSGQVEPPVDLAGVTELRVHGVGGTTPGQLLDDLAPHQVAGDSVAGFYRTLDAGGRHVEAYSWGGLTSRSGSRVLWLLLLPFMLANLAGWMCPPRARHSAAYRWLIRLAALASTLTSLVVAALGAMDVLGYQCGTDPGCTGRRWWLAPLRWGPVAGHPARQVLVGAVVPVAVLALLAALSYLSRERYETVRPPVVGMPAAPTARSAASVPGGLADPDFWDGARSTKRLGRAHTAAAIGLLTVALLHGVSGMLGSSGWLTVLQLLALACIAGGIALVAVEDGPDWPGAVLLATAVAVGLAAAVTAWLRPAAAAVPDGQLPGIRTVVTSTYVGLLGVMVLVLVATVAYGRAPGSFRALAPFVVLALAVAVLNLALLGLLVAVAQLVGPVAWAAGPGPAGTVSVWPVVQAALPYLTLVPVGALLLFVLAEAGLWWWAGRRPVPLEDEYAGCDPEPPGGALGPWQVSGLDDPAWRTALARARRLARAGTDVEYLLSALALFGSALMIWAVWQLLHGGSPAPGSRLTGIGTTLAVALPVALLAALRSGWRSLEGRRRLGVLWDVGTFWPRAFHPLAPPSYAERAVPDLQRRMWWLHDNGGTVVVAAHSQGTVLAAAALLPQTARAPGSRVGLVTFGSPLGKLYAWGFPAWVNDDVLAGLADPDTTWLNVHYATDYIGGPVFRSATAGVDRRLPDPGTSRAVYGQPLPAVGSHSGYWRDPAMWTIVDSLAAGLRPDTTDLDPGTLTGIRTGAG